MNYGVSRSDGETKCTKTTEKIETILKELNEDIILYDGSDILGEGIIDSFDILEIVSALEEELDLEIDPPYIPQTILQLRMQY